MAAAPSPPGDSRTAPPAPADAGPPGLPVVPWNMVDAIVVFFLSVVLTLVAGVVMSLVMPPRVPEAVVDAAYGPLTLLVLGLTLLGWIAARYSGATRKVIGSRRPGGRDVLVGVGAGIGAVIVVTAGMGLLLGLVLEVLGLDIPTVQQDLRDAARDPQTAPVLVLSAVLVAPLFEELFFRGMVLPALAKRIGLWGGIVVSALLFGVVHLNQAEDLLGGALLLLRLVPLGILFGWLYHWRGTIVVPIVVHSIFNAASVVLLLAGFD